MALGPKDLNPQFPYTRYSETEGTILLIDEALWRTQDDFGDGPTILTIRVFSPSLLVKNAVADRYLVAGWKTFIWRGKKIVLTK